jgi:hypothetical protein
MTTPEAERQMWVDYIGKLNDRALQRERASGFTTWAIVGVIALLVIHIISRLNVLTASSEALAIHILATTVALDLTLFGMLAFESSHYSHQLSPEIRLKSKLHRSSWPLFDLLLCLAWLFIVVLNLISATYAARYGLHVWSFWLSGIFLAFLGLVYVCRAVLSYRKKRKQGADLPDLAYSAMKDSIWTILQLVMFAFFVIALVPAVEAIPRLTKPPHLDTLMWSLAVAASFYLGRLLLIRSAGASHDRFLERLERRIILHQLSAEEIRSEFCKEYLGETVRDWLTTVENETKTHYEQCQIAISDMETKIVELEGIDPNMRYEVLGRREEICSGLQDSFEKYMDHLDKTGNQMQHLMGETMRLSLVADKKVLFEEVDALGILRRIFQGWENQLDYLRQRYDKVCTHCHEVARATAVNGQDCQIAVPKEGSAASTKTRIRERP